jgi:hypothetical protein
MNHLRRGGAAIAALALTLGIAGTALAGSATVESFSLDDCWSHEEPDGSVTWFDVIGTVHIVTTADGRQSATVQVRETQTAYLGSELLWQASSVSHQHAMSIGEDLFLLHLGSRSQWSGEIEGSQTYVLQIVNGEVIVEHMN